VTAAGFKDHFSTASDRYAAHRPDYPPELFDWLASLCPQHDLAWDCATGNGQAALGLTTHFRRIVASDASAAQVRHAHPHPQIVYRVAPAEDSGLAEGGVDLVTVAQAAHWFDLPAFYAEALRVLKPGGALAVWAYGLARITPAIDAIVDDFYRVRVGPFWPPERSWIDDGYRSLPFIPDEFPAPELAMRAQWNLDDLLACLATWSAVKRYQAGHGDPLPALREALLPHWGDPQQRLAVEWPLHLRAGRKPGSA
jgi:ubiquinone/menaquinone biosynthesis C-methylase UbiE